jgi:hypothetical protein
LKRQVQARVTAARRLPDTLLNTNIASDQNDEYAAELGVFRNCLSENFHVRAYLLL